MEEKERKELIAVMAFIVSMVVFIMFIVVPMCDYNIKKDKQKSSLTTPEK